MDEILGVFFHEASEKLDEMEAGLMTLEQGGDDQETLNAIFRAAHTIKGSAGVVEMTAIEEFTHVLENLLDRLREGKLQANGDMISVILSACDHIRALLACIASPQSDLEAALAHEGAQLVDSMRAWIDQEGGQNTAQDGEAQASVDARPFGNTGTVEGVSSNPCWHISVRFGRDTFRHGMDPAAFLQRLSECGRLRNVATLADTMPLAEEMDPESCYLGYEIDLEADVEPVTQANLEQVFQFVQDECALCILPPHSPLSEYAALMASLPESLARLTEIFGQSGALTPCASAASLLDNILLETAAGTLTKTVENGPSSSGGATVPGSRIVAAKERTGQDTRLVRVPAEKLDSLIDLVGELVIAGSSAQLLARQSGDGLLTEAMALLSRLLEEVRDASLQLRMVTVGETFKRFQRVVRDTARETGKQIDLELRGGETELDKSVVEKLADPLLHLVRNAIDHGIETAETRLARGKPVTGRVTLNAYHDTGCVVIEVADDGGGLNVERIRAKAVERGLIDTNATLGENDIYNLIFEPGFSTAEQVSNLSGRGVGMDVVKKSILALRGTIDVHSSPGQGTRFVLRLPLTLAMIDGFLVSVGGGAYVIPLDSVVECLELKEGEALGNVLNLRGQPLPFLALRDLFEIGGAAPLRQNVVVVQAGGQRAGIVVDQLQGEYHTVIKPLGNLFRHLRGLAGSSIMGSGDVALIIDVPSLIQLATLAEHDQNAGSTRHRLENERLAATSNP
ncbi:chemotaxis protein CheA [Dechloromonas agitata]|uniref:chemotaxis protein CheA n=1 Tax=Dechloromonas agitata TaxID=73030 RepID=UPI0004B33960|nr:chemotaxis protein CheA [Dechloromonas agitata]